MTDAQDITSMPKPFTWREVHDRLRARVHEFYRLTGKPYHPDTKLLLSMADRGDLFRDAGIDPANDPSTIGSVHGIPFEFRQEIPSRQMILRWEIDL